MQYSAKQSNRKLPHLLNVIASNHILVLSTTEIQFPSLQKKIKLDHLQYIAFRSLQLQSNAKKKIPYSTTILYLLKIVLPAVNLKRQPGPISFFLSERIHTQETLKYSFALTDCNGSYVAFYSIWYMLT